MSWQYGDRRPWPFEAEGDRLVSHECPLFGGITVVSQPASRVRPSEAIVPICGCYPYPQEDGK